jgi:hypothetical protein
MTGYPQSLIFLLVVAYIMIPCSNGCDAIEDINHLFLNCPVFGAVWSDIISWLGITWVLPDNAISVASQLCGAHGFCKKIRTSLQAIWLALIWSI